MNLVLVLPFLILGQSVGIFHAIEAKEMDVVYCLKEMDAVYSVLVQTDAELEDLVMELLCYVSQELGLSLEPRWVGESARR